MLRKLTNEEIENYKIEAKKIYHEAKLDSFYEPFIEIDLKSADDLIRWTDTLEKNPSVKNSIAAQKYFEKEEKNVPQRCKALGCSNEQVQMVLKAGLQLAETALFTDLIGQYVKAQHKVSQQESLFEDDNITQIIDYLKDDKSEDAIKIHDELKEFQVSKEKIDKELEASLDRLKASLETAIPMIEELKSKIEKQKSATSQIFLGLGSDKGLNVSIPEKAVTSETLQVIKDYQASLAPSLQTLMDTPISMPTVIQISSTSSNVDVQVDQRNIEIVENTKRPGFK